MDIICWNNSYSNRFFTARKRSLGQGNIFSSVSRILFTVGGSASVHAGIPPPPPRDQAPPRADTPQDQAPLPPVQCMLGDTVNKQAVCILLECNLVYHICWQIPFWLKLIWITDVTELVRSKFNFIPITVNPCDIFVLQHGGRFTLKCKFRFYIYQKFFNREFCKE